MRTIFLITQCACFCSCKNDFKESPFLLKLVHICVYIIVSAFLILSCSSPDHVDDDALSFDKISVMEKGHTLYYSYTNGWRVDGGTAKKDRTISYESNYPVLVNPDTSSIPVNLFYHLNATQIELGELDFSGMYKFQEPGYDTLKISIRHLTKNHQLVTDSIEIFLTPCDTIWSSFQISSRIFDKEAWFVLFNISSSSSSSFLIKDCKVTGDKQPLGQILNVEYGAQKDKEFDKGSGINLGELTSQKVENLEVLGKVWGFLKYYHPEVTQGKYNWDYELFRVLPSIADAKDRKERNRLLNKWIDKYGKIKETDNYIITDSTEYSRIINLDWINDKDMFDKKLIDKLNKIKSAKRNSKFNYYQLVPLHEHPAAIFTREKGYEKISWEDQGFRVLLLFKLWNLVEYCFPYTEMTDVPWNSLLKQSIPYFFDPETKPQYELEILKLVAHINDSHGHIVIPNSDLMNTVLAPLHTHSYRLPVQLTKSAEDYIVVKATSSSYVERGDIIYSVEGKPVTEIIEEMKPYIIASNEDGLIRNLLDGILTSDEPEMNITVIRNGKKKDLYVRDFDKTKKEETIKSWEDYNLSARNIIHVDNIKSAEQNRDIVQNNMHSKGLIIDMRVYPGNNNMHYMPYFLYPISSYPLWLSNNRTDLPGHYYYWHYSEELENPDFYRGKIAILVDENTQSAGETWSMWFGYTPQNIIIGSQTAGANGSITPFFLLPHGIKLRFSGQGAFYPKGETLQRTGIKIDIPVRPTVQDIKDGRDVWLEKAIEYIESD